MVFINPRNRGRFDTNRGNSYYISGQASFLQIETECLQIGNINRRSYYKLGQSLQIGVQ